MSRCSEGSINEELKFFILDKIESVGQLEVLCLLAHEPKKLWTAETLSKELRTNESMAASQLESLMKAGFLNQGPNGGYYFEPVENSVREKTTQLIELYRERRMMVINTIYSKPTEKVKNLAEAFKLRKGDK